jgi:hypothetical protein
MQNETEFAMTANGNTSDGKEVPDYVIGIGWNKKANALLAWYHDDAYEELPRFVLGFRIATIHHFDELVRVISQLGQIRSASLTCLREAWEREQLPLPVKLYWIDRRRRETTMQ